MNTFLNNIETLSSFGETENGAETYRSTGDAVLDFFSMGGAKRKNPAQGLELFQKAYVQNKEEATILLFHLRDVRGGQGERNLFRVCMQWLAEQYPKDVEDVIHLFAEYGRWDDILCVIDLPWASGFLKSQFRVDMLNADSKDKTVTLLGKWLPSENTSSYKTVALAKKVRNILGLNSKEYRKALSKLRKRIRIVESDMSSKDWNLINFSKVPSQAMLRYRNAFAKNEPERFAEYLEDVKNGRVDIKSKTLYPYQIITKCYDWHDEAAQLLWENLPDYTDGKKAIVVADTSGSMYGTPIDTALSLAMYFAERNTGEFKDKFITFSQTPTFQDLKGKNLYEKLLSIDRHNWGMSTNIQGVFDLVLESAKKSEPEDCPDTIYIVSDMEFDYCGENTNLEEMKKKYYDAGVKMPNLVFWNVDSRSNNVAARAGDDNTTLVSGMSPVVFKMAVEGLTPRQAMDRVISMPRYYPVSDALGLGIDDREQEWAEDSKESFPDK